MTSKRRKASEGQPQSHDWPELKLLEGDVRAELEHLLKTDPQLTDLTLDAIAEDIIREASRVELFRLGDAREEAIQRACRSAIIKSQARLRGQSALPAEAMSHSLIERSDHRTSRHGRRVTGSLVYDHAPIGTVIRFSDGTEMPPSDRPHQRRAWNLFNGTGRLIRKEPPINASVISIPATITLRTAEFGATGAVGLTFSVSGTDQDRVTFEIVELPPVGTIRVLGGTADDKELLFLARNHHAARQWLKLSGISSATLEVVSADEIAAATVEGRSLAS